MKASAMAINQDIEEYLKYEIRSLSEDEEMMEEEEEKEEEAGEVAGEEAEEEAGEERKDENCNFDDDDEKDKFDACMKEDDEDYIPAHTEISLFQKYLQHPLFNDD